jgi:hypothetical protein
MLHDAVPFILYVVSAVLLGIVGLMVWRDTSHAATARRQKH